MNAFFRILLSAAFGLFLAFSATAETLSYEGVQASHLKAAKQSLENLRRGKFKDVDTEFAKFERHYFAGALNPEMLGTTKREIYDLHRKYPTNLKIQKSDSLYTIAAIVLKSPETHREIRWGSGRYRAEYALKDLRQGKYKSYDSGLFDIEAFLDEEELTLAEIGVTPGELKELEKWYGCRSAKAIFRKSEAGMSNLEEEQQMLYLLKQHGPCPQ